MGKIRQALNLVKACWRALMLDKELLVFPLLSFSILIGILAVTLSPFVVVEDPAKTFDVLVDNITQTNEWTLGVIVFIAYFIAYLVMIFFNSALIACVKFRFSGGDPTVMYGLKQSMQRLPQIFLWAFVAATVGFILQLLEGKKEGQGVPSFILGLIGAAWAIASYFVVPIIVTEKLGPIAGVKRSIAIVKKTWGEAMISVVGISALGGIVSFVGFGFFMIAGIQMESAPELALILLAIGIFWILFTTLLFSTLGTILKAALYVYALNGKIPGSFDQTLVDNAFSAQKK